MADEERQQWKADELDEVIRRRRREALDAGMTLEQANEFAESELDIGDLRHLVEIHCPKRELARILL